MLQNTSPIVSISSMAMLVELRVSTWTARKRDSETSVDVNITKEADQSASSVYKYLMAGSNHLDKIIKYAAKCRQWNGVQTLPWMKGVGLLPMESFFKYREQLGTLESNFRTLCEEFFVAYPTLVNTQAFRLGKYYKAEEFPHVDSLRGRFRFEYNFLPVPEKGDFRVVCEQRVKADLEEQYEKMYQEKVQVAVRQPWERLHEVLVKMSATLTDSADGTRSIFRDSLVTNATSMCGMLTLLNITKDPELERARQMLERVINGVDADDLRKLPSARVELKAGVDEIIGKFNW